MLTNPAHLQAMLRDPTRLYPWLWRRGLATRPRVSPRRQAPWPLWALRQETPLLCRTPREALDAQADLFLAAGAELPGLGDTLLRIECQQGELFNYRVSPEGVTWHGGTNLLPAEVTTILQRLYQLYGLVDYQAFFLGNTLRGEPSFSLVSLSPLSSGQATVPPEPTGEPSLYPPLTALPTYWPMVALLEPILYCAYPPAAKASWRWELATKAGLTLHNPGTLLPPGISRALAVLKQSPPPELAQRRVTGEPSDMLRYPTHEYSYLHRALQNLEFISSLLPTDSAYHKALQRTQRVLRRQRWLGLTAKKGQPLLGIMYLEPRQFGEPFAFESLHFKQLAQMAAGYNMEVLIFAPNDLDLRRRLCWGYTLKPNPKEGVPGEVWVRGVHPLPQAVYLRGITSNPRELAERYRAIKQLERLNIPLLNSTEFMELCGDKQLWHNYLVKNGLGDYLLPTRPYSPANLRTMLRRYPLLFLKPRVGYEARGILRIAQGESLPAYNNTPHAIHWFSSARHRELQTGTCHFNSREGVLRSWEYTREAEFTAELQKLDFSGYIIQQGVHPATWRGHIFELRLIMQHDGIGWRCLGKVLRLTGRANLPLITADRETWQEALPVLQELFPGQGAALLQQSEEVAHQLAQSFSSGAMEFSLDFLIDTTARLWILEGNGKPSSFLVQIGDYHGRRHSLAAKLSFAQKLYLNTLPVSGTETQNDNRGTHQLIGS